MSIGEIIVAGLAFAGGTGLQWLLTLRSRRKQERIKADREEYLSMDEMVRGFRVELKEMTDRMSDLSRQYVDILAKLSQATSERDVYIQELKNIAHACTCNNEAIKKLRDRLEL